MTWWSYGFLIAIAAAIVAVTWWGIAKFNVTHARNIKYAERAHELTPERVAVVREAHPEIVKINRLDRHIWYVVPHLMVLGYTVSVFAGAELTSNVTKLGEGPRYTMATCFLVGSILVLGGACLGAKLFGRWTFGSHVSDHLTAEVLGDDIVFPYRLAMAGMSAMLVSASIYSFTSFQSTLGSLGGWFTGGIVICCVLTIAQLHRAVRTFQKWDTILLGRSPTYSEGTCDAH